MRIKIKTKNALKGRIGVPGSKPQDLDRRYDTTQLKEGQHGQYVHRDYAAHFFRWGFAGRFVTNETKVLDLGCGQDLPLVKVLCAKRHTVPKIYVGVDLNQVKACKIAWTRIYSGFDYIEGGLAIRKEHGRFDLVTCFEVLEHMHKVDGIRLLSAIRKSLADGGQALLSTPVYDGKKMAANHIHEWTIEELKGELEAVGLTVVRRFGTFASLPTLRPVLSKEEMAIVDRLSVYYDNEVISCFLAPLHPDASRNNVWVLRRA